MKEAANTRLARRFVEKWFRHLEQFGGDAYDSRLRTANGKILRHYDPRLQASKHELFLRPLLRHLLGLRAEIDHQLFQYEALADWIGTQCQVGAA